MGFQLGGLFIAYYGVIIAAAILVAFLLGLWLLKKVDYKEDIAYFILLFGVPMGIIGARIYYVIFSNWEIYNSFWDVINIRGGGMAIYGAVIGGALGLLAVARIKKCGWFTLADICVICLILAQAIGRWGNFMNDEAFGLCVSGGVFPFVVPGDSCPICGGASKHLATFFYESILNLVGFAFLLFIFFKNPKVDFKRRSLVLRGREEYKWGTATAWYLIWYGVVRTIIEPLRTDSLLMFGSNQIVFNRVSFMLSIALIAVGVLVLYAVKKGWVSQENTQCLKTNQTDTKKPKSTTS